jgi:WD40 repeat protein
MPGRDVLGRTVAVVAMSLAVFAPGPEAKASASSTSSLERTRPRDENSLDDPLPPRALARLGTIRLRHVGNVHSACLTPNGKLLYSCTYTGEILIWDTATGKLGKSLTGPQSDVRWLACSPDGQHLAGVGG